MNLHRNIPTSITASALALCGLMPACGQMSPQLGATAGNGTQGAQTSTPSSSVIPPSPVSGSFLTVVVTDADGDPIANAAVVVVESQYVGSTNLIGELQLPLEKLPADPKSLTLRLSYETLNENSEPEAADEVVVAELPATLRELIAEEMKNKGSEKREIGTRWGVGLPRDTAPLGQTPAAARSTSLPSQVNTNGSKVKFRTLSKFDNESNGSSARFSWDGPEGATVELAYSSDLNSMVSWTGGQPDQKSSSVVVLADYNTCTDTQFRNQSSGSFDPFVGKCGILFSDSTGARLNRSKTYYFRMAISYQQGNQTVIMLSPIEAVRAQD